MMDEGRLRRALETKRDGGTLDATTWRAIIAEYTAGAIDDAPLAALMMACAIRGMSDDEIVALTEAMIDSGETMHFPAAMTVVDKHSSGGVGDTISLVAVPIVAACGVPVAKLSGRALGHTGGTLDKLEAIPGVRTDLDVRAFMAQVERIGCAIAAQTASLVPADKKLYALRDRTGSVPSVGLIAASIVSKKIAGGAGAIVFDVKCGRGAFMHTRADAIVLAEHLVALCERFSRRASAFVSDMDEPLATLIGTGAEAIEARDFLRGDSRDSRFAELAAVICGEMLRVGGIDPDRADARYLEALESGAAYEKFVAMIEAQGGTRDALEALALAPQRASAVADCDGAVAAIDAVAIGEAARDLVRSAGATAAIRIIAPVGTPVRRGDVLAEVAGDPAFVPRVAAAFQIGAPPPPRPLVAAIVRDATGTRVSKARAT